MRRAVPLAIIVAFAELSLCTDVLLASEPQFNGIALTARDSTPDGPQSVKAPRGLCSPTRASLLSGRNHHHIGFGNVTEFQNEFRGYDMAWKKSAASIAEVLRRNGYSTAAFGKWHNTPYAEISPTGPFDHWPTSLGFEYFYGFMSGLESQWEPSNLYRNTIAVEPSMTAEQGYHFTIDITNEAIKWLHAHEALAPEKPYFLYFATGATHEPHHVPKEWIEKYRGQFDQGWDKVRQQTFVRQKRLGVIPANAVPTPRPRGLLAWASLSTDRKRLYARQMEVYAGFLAHTDHEVGRLLRAVEQGRHGENTLILYIVGDNGSSGMGGSDGLMLGNGNSSLRSQLQHIDELGGPLHYNLYTAGWAWVGATPFQGMKAIASHFGGVRAPLVVSWPARVEEQGGLREQFTHVTDIAATVYSATGIAFPSVIDGVQQVPLDGTSFIDTFDRANAPPQHHIQYFEMWGNRAIYQDGWVASARHDPAWRAGDGKGDLMKDRWQLYHVAEDFSEAHDLSVRYPDKLRELKTLFDVEARRNDVYPLLDGQHLSAPEGKPVQRNFVYGPDLPAIPLRAAPHFDQFSFKITADVMVPEAGAEGVIVSYGGRYGGFALYVKDDHLVCDFNDSDQHNALTSTLRVPRGKVVLSYEFVRDRPVKSVDLKSYNDSGIARLYVNGRSAGEARISSAGTVIDLYDGYFGIARAYGTPVSLAFRPPFEFNGILTQVQVELK